MDKTTIEKIETLVIQANCNNDLGIAGVPATVLSKDQQLVSLEHLQDQPKSFKGQFKTSLLNEFNGYVNINSDHRSSVFIDHDNMTATAIIDLGDNDQPHWGRHKATISLKDTTAYQALKSNNDVC